MRNFRYIDPIRDEKGNLRPWYEYNKIARGENWIDKSVTLSDFYGSERLMGNGYLVWKDKYFEERS